MTSRLLETNRHIHPKEMNDITRLTQKRKSLQAVGVVMETRMEWGCYNINEMIPLLLVYFGFCFFIRF